MRKLACLKLSTQSFERSCKGVWSDSAKTDLIERDV
jgi:hypothetical protein